MAKLLLLLLLAGAGTTAAVATGNSTTPTAYEMLERYDFPRGILPEGVRLYELQTDGSFEVLLSGDGGCEFPMSGRYVLRYSRRIAGSARAGSIRALEGVSVKVLFVWLDISKVDRDGDQLSFVVGPLRASFPLGNFTDSPLPTAHAAAAALPAPAAS